MCQCIHEKDIASKLRDQTTSYVSMTAGITMSAGPSGRHGHACGKHETPI